MIISVVGLKGGVGKTTTAIHVAAALAEKNNPQQLPQNQRKTLLIDDDPNESAINWASRGSYKAGYSLLPFQVSTFADVYHSQERFEDTVIDTKGHPKDQALAKYAQTCDVLLLPTTTDILAREALLSTVKVVREHIEPIVVITMVDSRQKAAIAETRKDLSSRGLTILNQTIHRLAVHDKAAQEGLALSQVKGQSAKKAWAEYKNMVDEIIDLYHRGQQ